MLENYCRINVTTENVPQLHLCLLQEELKLQTIESKVDNFREKWMGKDNINRQQPFDVKHTLSGTDVEQQFKVDRLQIIVVAKKYICVVTAHQSKRQEDTCHQNSSRVEFFYDVAFRKGRLKRIL